MADIKPIGEWYELVLTDLASQLHPVMLDGATGVGKTLILSALAKYDVQSIDLEALAVHRGSVLGSIPDQLQPSQRLFESQLLRCVHAM